MQANSKYNKVFVDKAWDDMVGRLDREMPVRKLPWALITSVIFALLAVGGGAYFYTSASEAGSQFEEQFENHPQQVSAAEAVDDADDVKKEFAESEIQDDQLVNTGEIERLNAARKNEDADQKTGSDLGEENSITGKKINSENQKSLSSPKPIITGETKEVVPNTNKKSALIIEEQKTTPTTILEADRTKPELATEPMVMPGSEAQPVRMTLPLAQLPVMPVGMIAASAESGNLIQGIQPLSSRKNRKFHLTIGAGTQVQEFNTILGFDGGLQGSFDLTNRLSVSLGAFYGYYKRDGYSAANKDVTLSSNGGIFNGGYAIFDVDRIYNNTLSYEEILTFTDSYSALHVPLTIDYQLSRKFRAGAGVRFSYLLNALSDFTIQQESNFEVLALAGQERSNFVYKNDLLNKVNIAPMVQLEYFVTRHFGIHSSFNYNLRPLINKEPVDGRTDYQRTLRMGIFYRI